MWVADLGPRGIKNIHHSLLHVEGEWYKVQEKTWVRIIEMTLPVPHCGAVSGNRTVICILPPGHEAGDVPHLGAGWAFLQDMKNKGVYPRMVKVTNQDPKEAECDST